MPTICLSHLNKEQIRAYIIADNRLAELAGWDQEILALELRDLLEFEDHLDLTLTGFNLDEIDQILKIGDDIEDLDEDVVVPKGPAITRKGDLWILGKHRVFCGDSLLSENIGILMGEERARLAFTDPPYNVAYEVKSKSKHKRIANDDLGKEFANFLETSCQNILSATDGAVYICMSSSELGALQLAFTKSGGHWSTFLIWAKSTFTIGRSDYQRQYEPILYGWREGAGHHWCGDRKQGDVWFFDKPTKNDIHPTMKPVGLAMRAIRNSSEVNDIVLDLFLGSGTTLMAAERTGRKCYGIEIDPLYVDAIIRRWQNHTGCDAVQIISGETFNKKLDNTKQGEFS